MKSQKLYMRASFTIEAVVVLPITMLAIAALICITLLLHDHTILTANCAESVLRNANRNEADGTVVLGKMVSIDGASVELQTENDAVTATGSGNIRVRSYLLGQMIGSNAIQTNTEIKAGHLDARKELLRYKLLAEGIELLKE